jgi:hypothetical protein
MTVSMSATAWPDYRDPRDVVWPIPQRERMRLAALHERGAHPASASPDGFRLATCVVCERPMVAMWHLWVNFVHRDDHGYPFRFIKEIHMCHKCATDIYGAPIPDVATGTFRESMRVGGHLGDA